jgi:hypothetical protein
LTAIRSHAFYAGLTAARLGKPVSPAQIAAARRDLLGLHIGWVLVWMKQWMAPRRPQHRHLHYAAITSYLTATGFRFDSKRTESRSTGPGAEDTHRR